MVRIPALRVSVQETGEADPLRMDVAGLVGFAQSGPLHTPVPVRSAQDFADVFGPDQPLAWDAAAGATRYGFLGPTVRAFFANGGRRCWVVRVAGRSARANRFPIPGLAGAQPDGRHTSVLFRARSPGSWSDPLRVSTRLEPHMLAAGTRPLHDGILRLPVEAAQALVPGDLLRLRYPSGLVAFWVVGATGPGTEVCEVGGQLIWFRRMIMGTPVPMRLTRARSAAMRSGSLLSGPTTAGGPLVVSVASVAPVPASTAGPQQDIVTAYGALECLTTPPDPAELAEPPLAERLTWELSVQAGAGQAWRIGGLGFAAPHPRFAGLLPSDDEVYAPMAAGSPLAAATAPWAALAGDILRPRFPLAGPGPGCPQLLLPVGMDEPGRVMRAHATALPAAAPARVRDGLTAYSTGMFLDPGLAVLPARALPQAVADRCRDGTSGLRGIHALWPVDEVSLVGVPDAAQARWRRWRSPRPAPAPVLGEPLPLPDGCELRWQGDPQAAFRLQQARQPDFAAGVTAEAVSGQAAHVVVAAPAPEPLYFRVRAEPPGQPGPWSNTVRARVPGPAFDRGDTPPPPAIAAALMPESVWNVTWSDAGPARYLLQLAPDPTFQTDVTSLPTGGERQRTVAWTHDGPLFLRVRAESPERAGPWSNTAVIEPAPPDRWRVADPEDPARDQAARLGLHAALLRLCRARGDLMALLSLPSSYRHGDLARYRQRLGDALGGPDLPALGYGALYAPWVSMPAAGDGAAPVPPEGPLLGRFAAVTLAEGAWRVPANVELTWVTGVERAWSLEDAAALAGAGVNLVQAAGRGFRVLTASTLDQDPARAPAGVRRLLILLRRILLNEGRALVFANNGPELRAEAVRRLQQVLTGLYLRGALAGDSPEQSFRVRADADLDPPGAADRGRLVIAVDVAPSQPLVFVSVRLLQAADGTAIVTEG